MALFFYTIKITHFKCISQLHLVNLELCRHLYVFEKLFMTQEDVSVPICSHFLFLPVRSRQQPTSVLFLSRFFFWTFHMNGIIQYVLFCISLSLSIMFLRFISVPFMCISSDGKESACNAGDLGSIPGLGRSFGEGNGNPLQYSCLENPWTKEPGGSPWGRRVGHDWATKHPP